jgi:hypothetical protein
LHISFLDLVLRKVKVMAICTIESNRVLALAVAKTIGRHAFTAEDLGKLLGFIKQMGQVVRVVKHV